jgi:hypothetical protein
MDPFSLSAGAAYKLSRNAFGLGNQIFKLADAADNNPILYNRLLEHVKIALDAVKYIRDLSLPTESFINSLRNLETILQECLTFLEKFHKRNEFTRFIHGKSDKKKLDELNQRLNDHKNRVLFGMVAYSFGLLSKMDQQQSEAISYNAGVQLTHQNIVQPRYNQTTYFVCMQ